MASLLFATREFVFAGHFAILYYIVSYVVVPLLYLHVHDQNNTTKIKVMVT